MEPHFMGLASDGIRAVTNYNGDDNTTCVYTTDSSTGPARGSGTRARSGTRRIVCLPIQDGFTAWATLMDEVGPLLHQADKLFSANTINGSVESPCMHI
jgi:hypothetical protein